MYQVIKMDMDFSEKLKGFEALWRRVQQSKPENGDTPQPPPQPVHKKAQSSARRFDPGRRL